MCVRVQCHFTTGVTTALVRPRTILPAQTSPSGYFCTVTPFTSPPPSVLTPGNDSPVLQLCTFVTSRKLHTWNQTVCTVQRSVFSIRHNACDVHPSHCVSLQFLLLLLFPLVTSAFGIMFKNSIKAPVLKLSPVCSDSPLQRMGETNLPFPKSHS